MNRLGTIFPGAFRATPAGGNPTAGRVPDISAGSWGWAQWLRRLT